MKTDITKEEVLKRLREARNPEEYIEYLKKHSPASFEGAIEQARMNRESFEKRMLKGADELKYFLIAKSLNHKFYDVLKDMKAHFRGNVKSYSLVSLDPKTPEIGISNLKKEYFTEDELLKFIPKEPKRETPEKSLQAWIILNAIQNDYLLPFGDNLTFVTSELAIELGDGKRIVNDILAIDTNNNLVVIELKSERVNKVKDQAIEFKKVIESRQDDFFQQLTRFMTGRDWNNNVRCMVVWPKAEGKARATSQEYEDVEVYQYYDNFKFEICR